MARDNSSQSLRHGNCVCPPAWVKSDSDTYRVKEAMDAIQEAMHRSDEIDPYDGGKMDSELLGAYNNDQSKERGVGYRGEFYRLPTVDYRNAEPVCDFQIISWQTNDA